MGKFQILNTNKYIVVNTYNDQLRIHVREYARYGDRFYPTPKGVFFNPSTFATLVLHADEITKALEEIESGHAMDFKVHLGCGIFCTISHDYTFVNLRKFFPSPLNGKLLPTTKGICLQKKEWIAVKSLFENIKSISSEIASASPCFFADGHNNLSGCPTCYPYGEDISYV